MGVRFTEEVCGQPNNISSKKSHPLHEVLTRYVQRWLIAQMKAYTILKKNLILICEPEYVCKIVLK